MINVGKLRCNRAAQHTETNHQLGLYQKIEFGSGPRKKKISYIRIKRSFGLSKKIQKFPILVKALKILQVREISVPSYIASGCFRHDLAVGARLRLSPVGSDVSPSWLLQVDTSSGAGPRPPASNLLTCHHSPSYSFSMQNDI